MDFCLVEDFENLRNGMWARRLMTLVLETVVGTVEVAVAVLRGNLSGDVVVTFGTRDGTAFGELLLIKRFNINTCVHVMKLHMYTIYYH